MKFTYTHIKEKDFSNGVAKANKMAEEGWRVINVSTRGGNYNFLLEKEVK
jgi:hypothetical protein